MDDFTPGVKQQVGHEVYISHRVRLTLEGHLDIEGRLISGADHHRSNNLDLGDPGRGETCPFLCRVGE